MTQVIDLVALDREAAQRGRLRQALDQKIDEK
jgi:hypothetical protein